MGNCALLMKSLGHDVSGSDHAAYPPMSDRLKESGISVLEGYDPKRLSELRPDLVVVGNVNTRGNPEVEWLLENRSVRYVSLPELLSEKILAGRSSVVVAGTHGKTTTTTLVAYLLKHSGHEPGYFIGGAPMGLPSGAAIGNDEDPFVIEGDEYDCAFFDKRSKFIHYQPKWLVLNNLEFDHADIFRDVQDVERVFSHLLKLVPANGAVIANSDDLVLGKLLHFDWAPIYRVGIGECADLRIVGFSEDVGGSRFDLIYCGKKWASIDWPMWGLFNARNAAMAALAAAFSIGLSDPTDLPLSSLSAFKGVRRRQEVIYADKDRVLMMDFGHHPTAIRQTLDSLRKRYPTKRVVLCFEARSNTACRNVHASEFEMAFDLADEVHLGSIFRFERYSDRDRIDLDGIASRLGRKAFAHGTNEVLGQAVEKLLLGTKDCLVVFFTNGSFDGIPLRLAEKLSRKRCSLPRIAVF